MSTVDYIDYICLAEGEEGGGGGGWGWMRTHTHMRADPPLMHDDVPEWPIML